MYGLINDAIRRLVLEDHGEEVWSRIVERSDAPHGTFAAFHPYDDALTYALVANASAEVAIPADEILGSIGRYWITRIAVENYRDFLEGHGLAYRDILVGLDDMHARIQAILPQLRPPSIKVELVGDDRAVLHYRSEREGLAPFLVGLLEGLAELCKTDVTITQTASRGESNDHDVFEVVL
ncbi:MAG: heme NO-binding domain-containing protein [Actinomycetes bacterium]